MSADLVTRLNQMAAAGYAGCETAKEAAERLAWTENYVKACDNEVKRANQRRMEAVLERDAIVEKLARLAVLLTEAIARIQGHGTPEDWRWTDAVERELTVMGESSGDVSGANSTKER